MCLIRPRLYLASFLRCCILLAGVVEPVRFLQQGLVHSNPFAPRYARSWRVSLLTRLRCTERAPRRLRCVALLRAARRFHALASRRASQSCCRDCLSEASFAWLHVPAHN